MIKDRRVNAAGKDIKAVAGPGTKRVESAPGNYVKIEVADQDRVRLWKVIVDNKWSGDYLGKNVFVFSNQQLTKIKEAGIPFRMVA